MAELDFRNGMFGRGKELGNTKGIAEELEEAFGRELTLSTCVCVSFTDRSLQVKDVVAATIKPIRSGMTHPQPTHNLHQIQKYRRDKESLYSTR